MRLIDRIGGCVIALCLLAPLAPDAQAKADPFRASAPPARQRAEAPTGFMWVVDPRTQCRAQIRRREISVQIHWNGACPDRVADGAGVLVMMFPDRTQTTCDLTFRGGLAHGRGACVFPDQHREEGTYMAGRPVGPGVLIFPDGSRYDGMIQNGQPHGRGTLAANGRESVTGVWSQGCLRDPALGRMIAVLRDADTCS